MQLVDVTDEHVGDRDADAADAVEQRHLGQCPAVERSEVVEQHDHDDEVERGDRERHERVQRERHAVLQLTADARADEVAPHVEAVEEPVHPPCTTTRMVARASTTRPIPRSVTAQNDWSASAPAMLPLPMKMLMGSWTIAAHGNAISTLSAQAG